MKSGSSGPKCACASLKPGITALPAASITFVTAGSIYRLISFAVPAASILFPFTATASAYRPAGSAVNTFPPVITRSAFSVCPQPAAITVTSAIIINIPCFMITIFNKPVQDMKIDIILVAH